MSESVYGAHVLSGEEIQEIGREAARRASLWLQNSTRVPAIWVNPDNAKRLKFLWPSGGNVFSFDIGGIMQGEPFNNDEFLAEVKGYSKEHDQPAQYVDYLAKCYVALASAPDRFDHFIWITWTPFRLRFGEQGRQRQWSALWDPKEIRKAVVINRERIFGPDISAKQARALLDVDLCDRVAERLWIIVLHEKQEALTITEAHKKLIYGEWSSSR